MRCVAYFRVNTPWRAVTTYARVQGFTPPSVEQRERAGDPVSSLLVVKAATRSPPASAKLALFAVIEQRPLEITYAGCSTESRFLPTQSNLLRVTVNFLSRSNFLKGVLINFLSRLNVLEDVLITNTFQVVARTDATHSQRNSLKKQNLSGC